MDAEINNVIYMELNSGPKIANSTCGKTTDVEMIDRDSTVYMSRKNIRPLSLTNDHSHETVGELCSIKHLTLQTLHYIAK